MSHINTTSLHVYIKNTCLHRHLYSKLTSYRNCIHVQHENYIVQHMVDTFTKCQKCQAHTYILQWTLSNPVTLGTEESILRCPDFRDSNVQKQGVWDSQTCPVRQSILISGCLPTHVLVYTLPQLPHKNTTNIQLGHMQTSSLHASYIIVYSTQTFRLHARTCACKVM